MDSKGEAIALVAMPEPQSPHPAPRVSSPRGRRLR